MSGRIGTAAIAVLSVLLLVAGCTSAPTTNGSPQAPTGPTAPLPAGALGPNPSSSFAWVGDPAKPLSRSALRTIADNNDVAVLTAWNDNYDLAENVREMKTLKALNPHIRVYLYFNASLFPTHIRGPYLTGFEPSSMALHDQSGNVITHGAGAQFPDGTSIYVDTTSPAYVKWAVDTIGKTVNLGYAGVVLDSYNGLVLGGNQARYWTGKIGADKVSRWNAGLVGFGHRLVERLGRDRVIYNGISPTLAGQSNRNLAHLSYLGGAVNEEFCVMYPSAKVNHLAQDVQIMQSQSGMLLEHVNTGGTTSKSRIDELNSTCYAAFLIGYRPGHSYYLSSTTYREDELYNSPSDVHLQLGAPTDAAQTNGSVLVRRFEHGVVFLNLGSGTRKVPSPVDGVLTSSGRSLGAISHDADVTVPGGGAAYVYTG